MNEDRGHIACHNLLDCIFIKQALALQDDFVTLDGYYFTRILIDEVFNPALEHASGKLLAKVIFQILTSSFYFFGQVKDLKNVLVILESDGTEQSCDRQLLLTVDIRVHNIINVCSKLDPTALEGDDTGRIEQRAIGMYTTAEEYAGRAVKL